MKTFTDVVVVGGGQAGVCAALSVARAGKKVILVQDRPVLGGNASSEGCVPSHGAEAMAHNRNCRDSGILEEIRLEYYQKKSPYSDSRQYWDLLLFEYCMKEENLTLLLNTRVTSCYTEESTIKYIHAINILTEDEHQISARIFIDASGDGFLAKEAGASYRWGREAADEFGENIFGQNIEDKKTLGSTIYGWAIKRSYPVEFSPPSWAVTYDHCEDISHRPHTKEHLFPTITASKDHQTLQFFWWLEWGGQLDVIKDSDLIYKRLLAELFGLWDHLKNSCTEATRNSLQNFELYQWSNFPLRRESRRVVGEYMINENDLFEAKLFHDRIAFGGWPLDDHPPEGISSMAPGCDQVFVTQPYSIPYRSVISKDIHNLYIAGRCMSATHSALSSIRVMNTLGIIGEAIGTAAALCIEKKYYPRDVLMHDIQLLQQRIIDNDLYLINVKDENQRNVALGSHVEVSSHQPLKVSENITDYIELVGDTVLQIPISTRNISNIKVCLRSKKETQISWKVFLGNHLGAVPAEPVNSGTMQVLEEKSWYELEIPSIDAANFEILSIVLCKNQEVSWAYGSELFNTRWGVKSNKESEGVAYHGRSRIAPTNNPWIFVNHHGRLPEKINRQLAEKNGFKIHGKLYATPLFEITPTQHPYSGGNLINGKYRADDLPNIWISESGFPQWATFSFRQVEAIKRVEIIFDTQLDYSDQKYGFPRGQEDNTMPHCIMETVKHFALEVKNGDQWEKIHEEKNNIQRRYVISFDSVIEIKVIRLMIFDTWGDKSARVYGVKCFTN